MADDQTNDTNLGAEGLKNQVEGKVTEATGTVQKKAGQVTGDTSTEVQGAARELKGKAQNAGGQAESKADDLLNQNPTTNP